MTIYNPLYEPIERYLEEMRMKWHKTLYSGNILQATNQQIADSKHFFLRQTHRQPKVVILKCWLFICRCTVGVVLHFCWLLIFCVCFLSVIDAEKADSRAEVKSFDKSQLKHVETEEKNPTPTAQTLREELVPDELPDRSAELKEIQGFDPAKKLKHVETADKTHLPTKEGMIGCSKRSE